MIPRRLRQVVRHFAGWGIVVFFVVLLTLIFSFLGTIICAALAGMMIGAARLPRWQGLLISLIFPAVIFAVLRTSGAMLSVSQVSVLALLCLGAFWLIYTVMGVMLRFEQAGKVGSHRLWPTAKDGLTVRPISVLQARVPESGAPAAATEISLEALQGKWRPEPDPRQLHSAQRILEITAERLQLSLTNSKGEASCCFSARLKLSSESSHPHLSVSVPDGLAEQADTLICI